MKNIIKKCAAIVVVMSMVGCTTIKSTGPRLDQDVLNRIEDNHTTKDTLVQLLGQPVEILRDDDTGVDKYIYKKDTVQNEMPRYCRVGFILLYGLFIPACYKDYVVTNTDRLTVYFNSDDIVTKHIMDHLKAYGNPYPPTPYVYQPPHSSSTYTPPPIYKQRQIGSYGSY